MSMEDTGSSDSDISSTYVSDEETQFSCILTLRATTQVGGVEFSGVKENEQKDEQKDEQKGKQDEQKDEQDEQKDEQKDEQDEQKDEQDEQKDEQEDEQKNEQKDEQDEQKNEQKDEQDVQKNEQKDEQDEQKNEQKDEQDEQKNEQKDEQKNEQKDDQKDEQKDAVSIVVEDLCAEDLKEIIDVEFQNMPEIRVFPKNTPRFLDDLVIDRLRSLTGKSTIVLVFSSLQRFIPVYPQLPVPDDLLCDLIVVSPGTATMVLSLVKKSDQSDAVTIYNANTARGMTAMIREKCMSRFTPVNGVLSTSDLTREDTFKTKIHQLEAFVLKTAIQHTLCMSADGCRRVLQELASVVGGTSLSQMVHKKPRPGSKFETQATLDDQSSSFPRQFLDEADIKTVKQLQSTGVMILPTSVHDYLRSHVPKILSRINSEVDMSGGWVYVQKSLLKTFGKSDTVPRSVFCDVIIVAPCRPCVKILTFTFDDEETTVDSYIESLASVVEGIVSPELMNFVQLQNNIISIDNIFDTKERKRPNGLIPRDSFQTTSKRLLDVILKKNETQRDFSETERDDDDKEKRGDSGTPTPEVGPDCQMTFSWNLDDFSSTDKQPIPSFKMTWPMDKTHQSYKKCLTSPIEIEIASLLKHDDCHKMYLLVKPLIFDY